MLNNRRVHVRRRDALTRHNEKRSSRPMTDLRTNLVLTFDTMVNHRLRTALTVLGLTMGVAVLIMVVTLILGEHLRRGQNREPRHECLSHRKNALHLDQP